MVCGVYKITNNINERVYIGQSVDIEDRWKQHKYALNSNVRDHSNRSLQDDWNIYGEDAFGVHILEECDPIELNRIESRYIKKYNARDSGYNIGKLLDYDSLTSIEINKCKARLLTFLSEFVDKSLFLIDNVANALMISNSDVRIVAHYITGKDEQEYNVAVSLDFLSGTIRVRKWDIQRREIRDAYNCVNL